MATIKISEGQSLLDVALWLLGGTEGLFALADANGLAIMEYLVAGQVLVVPDGVTVSADVVSYYQELGLRVNTANVPHQPAPLRIPVDFDDENDFTTSDFN